MKKLEEEVEEVRSQIKEKEGLYKSCADTVSTLEKSIKDHDKNREGRLKDLEKNIKTIKARIQASSKDLKVLQIFQSKILTLHLNFFNLFLYPGPLVYQIFAFYISKMAS